MLESFKIGFGMRKFLISLLIIGVHANLVYAEEADVLSEEILLGNTITGEVQENNETSESATENNKGWFNFIIKPISDFFSSNENVTVVSDENKETPLEKSIRQANKGNLEDQMNLAYMYLYGTNGVEQDAGKAFQYYSMAAEHDDPIALNNLGSLYFNGLGVKQDIKTALALFERASELGNDNASLNLAFIYLTGGTKDATRNNKAIQLFNKAQEEGNKIAKFMLGYAYYTGFIVEKNHTKAFELIRAAASGDAQIDEAQLILAELYKNGYGTTQNYQKSLVSYKAAVFQGNINALIKLAEIYSTGSITAPNPILAHALYNIAAAKGVEGAAEKRDEIGTKLNLEQLTAAQNQAQEFKDSPSELTSYIRQTYGNNLCHYIDINM